MAKAHSALRSAEQAGATFSWPSFASQLLNVREDRSWGCWLQDMYEGQLHAFFGEKHNV